MNARTPLLRTLFLALAMALLAACAQKEDAARKAVAQVDAAIAAVAPDAKKLFPPHLAAVLAQSEQLKVKLADGDYAAVVADAPAVLAEVQALADQVAAKNADTERTLKTAWAGLEKSVPAALQVAETQIQAIVKSGKAPPGTDPQIMTMAQSGLGEYQALWARAVAAHDAGDLQQAVELGSTARRRIANLTRLLGGPPA